MPPGELPVSLEFSLSPPLLLVDPGKVFWWDQAILTGTQELQHVVQYVVYRDPLPDFAPTHTFPVSNCWSTIKGQQVKTST